MYKIFHTFTNKDDGNLAYHVQDIKENVDENRKNLALKHNFDLNNLVYMNQVHGNNVIIVDKNSPRFIDNCDALITKDRDLTLMVMVADCIPILFFDKVEGVIAAVHAGRNSTFLKISQITANKMINELNCEPKNIEVILGPSIQKCCYEVNQQMADIVKKSFGEEFVNERFIDLQGINKKQLNEIKIRNISICNICTKCSGKEYFSYRKDNKCGRFSALVSIES